MSSAFNSRAAVHILVGVAIIGLIDNFVRFIAEDASVWQFHVLRSMLGIPLLYVVVRFAGGSLKPLNLGKVALRTFFQVISMFCYFGSLALMPISAAAAGLFTSPIFVLIYSVVLFRLRVGPRRILAVILGSIGVVILLQPGGEDFSLLSILPVVAGAFYGLSTLTARQWCAEEPTELLLMSFFVGMGVGGALSLGLIGLLEPSAEMVASTPFLLLNWQAVDAEFWMWTAIQAVGSLMAVWFLTRGYQMGETSYLAIFEYTFLIFASFWGWVIWGQTIGLVQFLGIGLIVLAGVIIIWRGGEAPGRAPAPTHPET